MGVTYYSSLNNLKKALKIAGFRGSHANRKPEGLGAFNLGRITKEEGVAHFFFSIFFM